MKFGMILALCLSLAACSTGSDGKSKMRTRSLIKTSGAESLGLGKLSNNECGLDLVALQNALAAQDDKTVMLYTRDVTVGSLTADPTASEIEEGDGIKAIALLQNKNFVPLMATFNGSQLKDQRGFGVTMQDGCETVTFNNGETFKILNKGVEGDSAVVMESTSNKGHWRQYRVNKNSLTVTMYYPLETEVCGSSRTFLYRESFALGWSKQLDSVLLASSYAKFLSSSLEKAPAELTSVQEEAAGRVLKSSEVPMAAYLTAIRDITQGKIKKFSCEKK